MTTETTWVHRCMILAVSVRDQIRNIAATVIAPDDAMGMWTTPLSPTASAPYTHYISTGLVDEALAAALDTPEGLAAAGGITLAEAEALLADADISEEDPQTAMNRLGLKLIVEDA